MDAKTETSISPVSNMLWSLHVNVLIHHKPFVIVMLMKHAQAQLIAVSPVLVTTPIETKQWSAVTLKSASKTLPSAFNVSLPSKSIPILQFNQSIPSINIKADLRIHSARGP